jgi:hypothetical protein
MRSISHKEIVIQSGGQTGADRAALDWAIENKVQYRGWCPRGRLAEDGLIPKYYELVETKSSDYAIRTQMNVRDSDGTVIISIDPHLNGGSQLTEYLAHKLNQPVLHIHSGVKQPGQQLQNFVQVNEIKILNMAGPRASKEPEVYKFVKSVLQSAFT